MLTYSVVFSNRFPVHRGRKANLIYKKGDKVVHPNHGAAVVAGYRTVEFQNKTRRYLILDLRDSSNSTVMVPGDRLEDLDIRPVTVTLEMVRQIMAQEPRILNANYRTRQSNVEERVSEGDPGALIRTLRDLYYREHTEKLTKVDKDIQKRIRVQLIRELALSASLTRAEVRQRLKLLIAEAMDVHLQRLEMAAV